MCKDKIYSRGEVLSSQKSETEFVLKIWVCFTLLFIQLFLISLYHVIDDVILDYVLQKVIEFLL